MQTDRKFWSLRNSQSETWIHESGKKLAQAYLLPLSRTTLWHMGQSLSVLFSVWFESQKFEFEFSVPSESSDLKAMSLYLRLLGGHVSLFATVAISEPPLEPRKLQVAEAATATPWFKSFQIYIYIYIYIVHSFKMLPFWFKPLLWITLLVVHWPMQILWYAASEIQMLMVCLV